MQLQVETGLHPKIPPCQEVQEMREQKGAATAIQARYRQRAAQREVDALRKEKQELQWMAAVHGASDVSWVTTSLLRKSTFDQK